MRALSFLFCAHSAHHIVRYCLKWFNKHFVLWQSVIILRPSRQPMALQISPILSTPHFILLHAGRFTARQRRWLNGDRKNFCPFFPRESSNRLWGKKKPVPTVTPSWRRVSVSQWRWGLVDVLWHDQLRGLIVIWCVCGPVGMWVHSRRVFTCVCLPVGVCVCDRAPHCCSDVSSLCPRPMTVTPSLPVLSWGIGVSGLPLLSAPPSSNPLPFLPQPLHPPTCSESESLSRPADLWLLLTNGCGLGMLTGHKKLVSKILQAKLRVNTCLLLRKPNRTKAGSG